MRDEPVPLGKWIVGQVRNLTTPDETGFPRIWLWELVVVVVVLTVLGGSLLLFGVPETIYG